MHMFGEYGAMGSGGFGMIFMFLFWGLIIGLIIMLIRQVNSKSKQDDTPIDIVKKRYAKGEISKQEFDRLMSELK